MNPLHLSGYGVKLRVSNLETRSELEVRDGRDGISKPYTTSFYRPRRFPYTSIIVDGHSGYISLQAIHWLSRNKVPVFVMNFDGSVISSILPPMPIKADLRAAQAESSTVPTMKLKVAKAIVEAKTTRSIQVLEWLAERYDVSRDVSVVKREALKLRHARTVNAVRSVEGRVALATERAKSLVQTFEAFIAEHKDEITALQILYNRPVKAPLRFEDVKALADTLHAPPHLMDESVLWQAYAALDKSKVKGGSTRRILTDLVSLVRFAMHQENELVPYPERVAANFKAWLAQTTRPRIESGASYSREGGNPEPFTPEQQHWLEMIRDHIAANLGINLDDFELSPFNKEGGLGRVHQVFGKRLPQVIEELNRELVA